MPLEGFRSLTINQNLSYPYELGLRNSLYKGPFLPGYVGGVNFVSVASFPSGSMSFFNEKGCV